MARPADLDVHVETCCDHSTEGDPRGDDSEAIPSSWSKTVLAADIKYTDKKWRSKACTIPKAVIVRRTLLTEAVRILELVNRQYGIGDAYLEDVLGRRISVETAQTQLKGYLRNEGVEENIRVKWLSKLTCTACLSTSGRPRRFNKPERTKFTLLINSTPENMYMREHGIRALANHEIGTHYFRARNEGYQVWYSCRSRFKLCCIRCYKMLLSEEGLATLNTYLSLKCKLLWKPALIYYTAHMAQRMESSELFDHLQTYVLDPDIRKKIVLRAKRGSSDTPGDGRSHVGCGWDQCYFIGAVKILRRLDKIDFTVMHSGKLPVEEVDHVARIAKTSVLKLPHFISNSENLALYTRTLVEMKQANLI